MYRKVSVDWISELKYWLSSFTGPYLKTARIWLVAGKQLQLRNRRSVKGTHDNTDDKSVCEGITHLHRPTPGLNCRPRVVGTRSKIQVK